MLKVVLLGFVQGVTEFLPVSSSGHLALLRLILQDDSFASELAFDVILHLATLLSVVIAFRKALWRLLGEERKLLFPLMVSSACLGLVLLPVGDGLRVKEWIELAQGQGGVLAVGFFITAALLASLSLLDVLRSQGPSCGSKARAKSELTLEEQQSVKIVGKAAAPSMTVLQALILGLFQVLAVMPGISRSGSTIAAGRYTGLSRKRAFEYAFLMSIPAILGATVLEAARIQSLASLNPLATAIGFCVACLTGLLSISLLRWLVSGDRLWLFVPYLLCCGLIALFY